MPKVFIDTALLYSPVEAAKELNIGYATLYRWIKNGQITPFKIDYRTFISLAEIDRVKKVKKHQS